MSNFWNEYVKASYDLIIESEGRSHVYLADDVEVYIVNLFARNFTRTDIGSIPIAKQILETNDFRKYSPIADECLLINSYPLRRSKWPSESYYKELGVLAYKRANNDAMKENFDSASKVLNEIFKRVF